MRRKWIAAALAVGFAGVGCKQIEDRRAGGRTAEREPTAQTEVKGAYQGAQKAAEEARKKLDEAARADGTLAKEQDRLISAEQKAAKARAEAQSASARAAEEGRAAGEKAAEIGQRGGDQVKQAVEAAQARAGSTATAQGEAQEHASGKLLSATGGELVVEQPSGGSLRVQVDERTRVTLDGIRSSRDLLPAGANVDVAYRRVGAQAIAERVDGRTTM